jgi:hydroxyacylglutathione hydrolase
MDDSACECFCKTLKTKIYTLLIMLFERYKAKIVAHLSYFIGSDSEALVVDPRRDCHVYVSKAQQENVKIKYIFETHRNEDYVIGSLELAHLTGAAIYHGPWPDFHYGHVLTDGQEFHVGKLKVTALHTPGHTPGCMSYVVADLASGEAPVLVCTGDALFVNDVGRTDFGGVAKRWEWSENLYQSIFEKLLPLGDGVILCPAHGAGSVCGGNIAEREWSTLGLERRMNPLLQLSREAFVDQKVHEHHEYAPYFRLMEKYNVEGALFIGDGPKPPALSPKEFQDAMNGGATVIDIRSPLAFNTAHLRGSYNIPKERLSKAGWVIPYDVPLLLVVNTKADLDYTAISLSRLGYDNIKGYLGKSVNSWLKVGKPIASSGSLTAHELQEKILAGEDLFLLDVRSQDEWEKGRIADSRRIYVGLLEKHLKEVPTGLPIVIICKSGNRSNLAASILLRDGRTNIFNLLGGITAWQNAGFKIIP